MAEEREGAALPPVHVLFKVLPIALAWGGFLVSAWAWGERPAGLDALPELETFLLFLGAPSLSGLLVAGFALASRRTAGEGPRTHAMVAWMTLFLLGIHGLLLGFLFGWLSNVPELLAGLVGSFFLGLAPLVWRLEVGSVLGVRTPKTLSDSDIWGRAHVVLGAGFGLAGAVALVAAFIPAELRLAASTLPAAIAVTAAVFYGMLARPRSNPPRGPSA